MNWRKTTLLALAWLILSSQAVQCSAGASAITSQLVYSRTELLGGRDSGVLPSLALLNDVPAELLQQHRPGPRRVRKARKRGRRASIRQRIWRATKLLLTPVVL